MTAQTKHWTQRIDEQLFHMASRVGPWFVPLAPAIVFGFAAYNALFETLSWAGVVVGISIAIALEVAGILGFHGGVMNLGRDGRKAAFGFLLGFAYVIIGVVTVLAVEVSDGFTMIGIMSFLIIPITYLARALIVDLRYSEEAEADNTFYLRELEKYKLETNRMTRMKRIEHPKSVRDSVQESVQLNVQPLTIDVQKSAILDAFSQQPRTKVAHIARTLDISRTTVYTRIEQLMNEGKLDKTEVGYMVPVASNGLANGSQEAAS